MPTLKVKCWPYSWSEQDARLEKENSILSSILRTWGSPMQKLKFQVDPKEEVNLERRKKVRGGLL